MSFSTNLSTKEVVIKIVLTSNVSLKGYLYFCVLHAPQKIKISYSLTTMNMNSIPQ